VLTDRWSDPEDTDLPFHTKGRPSSRRTVKAEGLKAELKALLKEPLVARGVSAKYPTSGSKVIIDDLLASAGMSAALVWNRTDLVGHGTLLGAPTLKAHEEVQKPKKKLFKKKPVKPKATTS
jgi:ATP-dependent RNA helicase DDX24/MAK5